MCFSCARSSSPVSRSSNRNPQVAPLTPTTNDQTNGGGTGPPINTKDGSTPIIINSLEKNGTGSSIVPVAASPVPSVQLECRQTVSVGTTATTNTTNVSSPLSFVLNGVPRPIDDPSMLLIDYLHTHGYVGTKLGCGQGGCGACTVNVNYPDSPNTVRAVNSCLKPCGLLDGLHVTTIEGLPQNETIQRVTNGGGLGANNNKNREATAAAALQSRKLQAPHQARARGGKMSCASQPTKSATASHDSPATHECELHSNSSLTHPEVKHLIVPPTNQPKATLPPNSEIGQGEEEKSSSNELCAHHHHPAACNVNIPDRDPRLVLASFNGTQCGFCSAGMVMTMNQQLVGSSAAGGNTMNEIDIEDLFSGNICRCTGYRPILCGFKTYARDGNQVELKETPALVMDESVGYGNGFTRSPNVDVINFTPVPPPAPHQLPKSRRLMMVSSAATSSSESSVPLTRLGEIQKSVHGQVGQESTLMKVTGGNGEAHSWYVAKTFMDMYTLAQKPGDVPLPIKFIVGNTSYGVFPQQEWAGIGSFVDISKVIELQGPPVIESPDSHLLQARLNWRKSYGYDAGSETLPVPEQFLFISSITTIQSVMDWLRVPTNMPHARNQANALVKHWKRVAGHQVRNAGSIGGSLCMARYWNFPSDTWLLFEGMCGMITYTPVLSTPGAPQFVTTSMKAYSQLLNQQTIIVAIHIPVIVDTPDSVFPFDSYRVAQRLQNSHPQVNAAFFYDGTAPPVTVFGNISPTPVCASQRPVPSRPSTSHYRLKDETRQLIWKATLAKWQGPGMEPKDVLEVVLKELFHETENSEKDQGPGDLRASIATNLLHKFMFTNLGAPGGGPGTTESIYSVRTSAASVGSQRFLVNRSEEPVSEPLVKSNAIAQTSGRLEYTTSMRPDGILHATFVTSWSATGLIKELDPSAMGRAVAYLKSAYGITDVTVDDFHLIDARSDSSLQKCNLLNGANYVYSPQNYPPTPGAPGWPQQPVFQSFPTYLVAQVEVVYQGQPIALLAGPTEVTVTLAAAYLSTEASGYLTLSTRPEPILSVAQSKVYNGNGTITVDGVHQGVPTELRHRALYVPANPDGSPGTAFAQTYESISNVIQKPGQPYQAEPDFTKYKNDKRYVYVEGEHEVPGQIHFYMEPQCALAKKPTKAMIDPPRDTSSGSNNSSSPVPPPTANSFMTVYSSTQALEQNKGETTRALNAAFAPDIHEVDIVAPPLGGGFGGKTQQSKYACDAAGFLAKKLDRDVRFTMSRDTDTQVIGGRHPMSGSYRAAVEIATGKIVAMAIELELDAGANYDSTQIVGDTCLISGDTYQIESLDPTTGWCISSTAYFTNKSSSTAFRSYGIIQAQHFGELAMQKAVEKLGVNAFTFRGAHLYPYSEGPNFPVTPYHQPIKYASADSVWIGLDEMLGGVVTQVPLLRDYLSTLSKEKVEKLKSASKNDHPPERKVLKATGEGYNELLSAVEHFNQNNTHLKMGLAVVPCKYGIGYDAIKINLGEAIISCDENGQFLVLTSGVEMGQGLETKMRQIASLKLGVWSTAVAYQSNIDSKWFAPTYTPKHEPSEPSVTYILPGTGATTGADLNGGAVVQAANALLAKIEAKLQGNVVLWEEYLAQNRRFYLAGSYDENGKMIVAPNDLWPKCAAYLKSIGFLPLQADKNDTAYFIPPDMEGIPFGAGPKKGVIAYYYTFAAAGVLSLVDSHTGESCVLSANIVYDAGISLNPATDIGQVEGGFVQGLGYNTCEEVTHDDLGVNTSINTWTYKPPSTLEIPMQFNIRLWPLANQVRSWREEEKKLLKADGLELPPHHRLTMPHKKNRYRKVWMRVDPDGQLIDPYGVQSSKATGEPPTVLGNAVWFALREAVKAVRQQRYRLESNRHVPLNEIDVQLQCPATTFNTFKAITEELK